jgi:hypothetical protein
MTNIQLFEYAILLNEKRNRDNEVVEEATLVVEPTHLLARDLQQAQMLAARTIPSDMIASDKVDRLQVVVRPF